MLGVSSEYVYSLGYMQENADVSGGYMSGVGGANMGIGGYIDANYSIVAGRNNIVSASHSFVGGISNEILEGADNAFVFGTEIICPSGNNSAAMFGKYNEINNPEVDFEGGERMLLSVGNGVTAVEDISYSSWPGDGVSQVLEYEENEYSADVSFNLYGYYQGSFPDISRSDIFYVTNKSVGMQKIRISADVSINSLILSDSKTSDRYISFIDGVVTVFDNWDVSMVGIHTSGSITATNFFGDGKYLTGGSDDRGWRIFENQSGSTIDKYDYYVSAIDISYVKVVDTAFKRDIDIAQLCDIRLSSGSGSWIDDISGSEYRNSEYIFTDARSGDGPVKYALDKYDSNETTVGRYYGKGMMTRMTFVPHRKSVVADVNVNVCQVGSDGATPIVSGGIDVRSSETTGNILDIVYSGNSDIISYQKPVKKSFDSVFTVDRSSYGNIGNVSQFIANQNERLNNINTFNGTTNNVPQFQQSTSLAGSTYYRHAGQNAINIPYSPSLNTINFTVAFWIKFDYIPANTQSHHWNQLIVNRGSNSTGWQITINVEYIGGNPNRYQTRLKVTLGNVTSLIIVYNTWQPDSNGNASGSFGKYMVENTWYHLVLKYEAGHGFRFYKNGSLWRESGSNLGNYQNINAQYYIGGTFLRHRGNFFDYRHYSKALSTNK